eukprot:Nk52_evm10s369 gene=Nk52_evmTU10s369
MQALRYWLLIALLPHITLNLCASSNTFRGVNAAVQFEVPFFALNHVGEDYLYAGYRLAIANLNNADRNLIGGNTFNHYLSLTNSSGESLISGLDFYTKYPNTFLGLVGSNEDFTNQALASLTKEYKFPMISPQSSSPTLSDEVIYPYFFRTTPDVSQYAEGFAQLACYFGWKYFSVIEVSDIILTFEVSSLFQQCSTKYNTFQLEAEKLEPNGPLDTDLKDTIASVAVSSTSRVIYVAAVLEAQLIAIYRALADAIPPELRGDYLIISNKAGDTPALLSWLFSFPGSLLLTLDLSTITSTEDRFYNLLSLQNSTSNPYNLSSEVLNAPMTFSSFSSALYAWDAVYAFAHALNKTLEYIAADKVIESSNFTSNLFLTSFVGATGNVSFENTGDRIARFSLLNVLPPPSNHSRKGRNVETGFESVGTFAFEGNAKIAVSVNATSDILWPNGKQTSAIILNLGPFEHPFIVTSMYLAFNCSITCVHGLCSDINVCTCDRDWTGATCEKRSYLEVNDPMAGFVIATCLAQWILVCFMTSVIIFHRKEPSVEYADLFMLLIVSVGLIMLGGAMCLVVGPLSNARCSALFSLQFIGIGLVLASSGSKFLYLYIFYHKRKLPSGFSFAENRRVTFTYFTAYMFVYICLLFMWLFGQPITVELSGDLQSNERFQQCTINYGDKGALPTIFFLFVGASLIAVPLLGFKQMYGHIESITFERSTADVNAGDTQNSEISRKLDETPRTISAQIQTLGREQPSNISDPQNDTFVGEQVVSHSAWGVDTGISRGALHSLDDEVPKRNGIWAEAKLFSYACAIVSVVYIGFFAIVLAINSDHSQSLLLHLLADFFIKFCFTLLTLVPFIRYLRKAKVKIFTRRKEISNDGGNSSASSVHNDMDCEQIENNEASSRGSTVSNYVDCKGVESSEPIINSPDGSRENSTVGSHILPYSPQEESSDLHNEEGLAASEIELSNLDVSNNLEEDNA